MGDTTTGSEIGNAAGSGHRPEEKLDLRSECGQTGPSRLWVRPAGAGSYGACRSPRWAWRDGTARRHHSGSEEIKQKPPGSLSVLGCFLFVLSSPFLPPRCGVVTMKTIPMGVPASRQPLPSSRRTGPPPACSRPSQDGSPCAVRVCEETSEQRTHVKSESTIRICASRPCTLIPRGRKTR